MNLLPDLGNIKIQVAPVRRVADMFTVWHEKGDEIDMVLDLRYSVPFRDSSIKELYVCGLLGYAQPEKIEKLITDLYKTLAPGGTFYFIEPDFDYLTRSAVEGTITPQQFSSDFSRKSYVTLQTIAEIFGRLGIPHANQVVWFQTENLKIEKRHYEMIISGRKGNG